MAEVRIEPYPWQLSQKEQDRLKKLQEQQKWLQEQWMTPEQWEALPGIQQFGARAAEWFLGAPSALASTLLPLPKPWERAMHTAPRLGVLPPLTPEAAEKMQEYLTPELSALMEQKQQAEWSGLILQNLLMHAISGAPLVGEGTLREHVVPTIGAQWGSFNINQQRWLQKQMELISQMSPAEAYRALLALTEEQALPYPDEVMSPEYWESVDPRLIKTGVAWAKDQESIVAALNEIYGLTEAERERLRQYDELGAGALNRWLTGQSSLSELMEDPELDEDQKTELMNWLTTTFGADIEAAEAIAMEEGDTEKFWQSFMEYIEEQRRDAEDTFNQLLELNPEYDAEELMMILSAPVEEWELPPEGVVLPMIAEDGTVINATFKGVPWYSRMQFFGGDPLGIYIEHEGKEVLAGYLDTRTEEIIPIGAEPSSKVQRALEWAPPLLPLKGYRLLSGTLGKYYTVPSAAAVWNAFASIPTAARVVMGKEDVQALDKYMAGIIESPSLTSLLFRDLDKADELEAAGLTDAANAMRLKADQSWGEFFTLEGTQLLERYQEEVPGAGKFALELAVNLPLYILFWKAFGATPAGKAYHATVNNMLTKVMGRKYVGAPLRAYARAALWAKHPHLPHSWKMGRIDAEFMKNVKNTPWWGKLNQAEQQELMDIWRIYKWQGGTKINPELEHDLLGRLYAWGQRVFQSRGIDPFAGMGASAAQGPVYKAGEQIALALPAAAKGTSPVIVGLLARTTSDVVTGKLLTAGAILDATTKIAEQATSAGIPMMITQAMKDQLGGLGFSAAAIDKMTPAEAWANLINKSVPPELKGITDETLARDFLVFTPTSGVPGDWTVKGYHIKELIDTPEEMRIGIQKALDVAATNRNMIQNATVNLGAEKAAYTSRSVDMPLLRENDVEVSMKLLSKALTHEQMGQLTAHFTEDTIALTQLLFQRLARASGISMRDAALESISALQQLSRAVPQIDVPEAPPMITTSTIQAAPAMIEPTLAPITPSAVPRVTILDEKFLEHKPELAKKFEEQGLEWRVVGSTEKLSAIEAVDALKAEGWQIPKDISEAVFGFKGERTYTVMTRQAVPAVEPAVPAVEGIPMPREVQAEFLQRAEALLPQIPDLKPSHLHSVGVPDGEMLIRTNAQSQVQMAALLLMREGQLTLSTLVGRPEQVATNAPALRDIMSYIREHNIALPPRAEMSPEAISIIDRLAAPAVPGVLPQMKPAPGVTPLPATEAQKQLGALLTTTPTHIDELIRQTGLPAGQVSSELTMLQLRGAAHEVSSGLWVSADIKPVAPVRITEEQMSAAWDAMPASIRKLVSKGAGIKGVENKAWAELTRGQHTKLMNALTLETPSQGKLAGEVPIPDKAMAELKAIPEGEFVPFGYIDPDKILAATPEQAAKMVDDRLFGYAPADPIGKANALYSRLGDWEGYLQQLQLSFDDKGVAQLPPEFFAAITGGLFDNVGQGMLMNPNWFYFAAGGGVIRDNAALQYLLRPQEIANMSRSMFNLSTQQEALQIIQNSPVANRMLEHYGDRWEEAFSGALEKMTSTEMALSAPSPEMLKEMQKLPGYKAGDEADLFQVLKEYRGHLDTIREKANYVRRMLGMPEIPYIEGYVSHMARVSVANRLIGLKPKIWREYQDTKVIPDYVEVSASFNPFAEPRHYKLPEHLREKRISKLMSAYADALSRDIFITPAMKYAMQQAKVLEARGLERLAQSHKDIADGLLLNMPGGLDKWIKEHGLGGTIALNIAQRMREFLTMSVFPLNFKWQAVVQPSSLALNARCGARNVLKGTVKWMTDAQFRHDLTHEFTPYFKREVSVVWQDIDRILTQGEVLGSKKLYSVVDILSWALKQEEWMLTGISMAAGWYRGLELGLEGDQLRHFASITGAQTQSIYMRTMQSALFRNQAIRSAIPFQTFILDAYNNMREWIGAFWWKTTGKPPPDFFKVGAWKERATGFGDLMRQLLHFLIAAHIFNTIGDAVDGRKPWEVKSWIPFEAQLRFMMNPYQTPAMAAPLFIAQGIDFKRAIDDLMNPDIPDDQRYDGLRRFFLRYYTLAGTSIDRAVEAWIASSRGAVTNRAGEELFEMIDKAEDPRAFIMSMIMGVYSTEEGKDYLRRIKEGEDFVPGSHKAADELRGRTDLLGQVLTPDNAPFDLKRDIGKYYTTAMFASDMQKYADDLGIEVVSSELMGFPELASFWYVCLDYLEFYDESSVEVRKTLRYNRPEMDAILLFWGKVDTVLSDDAEMYAAWILDHWDLPPEAIPAVARDAQGWAQKREYWRRWRQYAGQ